MGKYEIAVFDVDGTLLDTTEGVLASVKYTIDKMGFEPLSEDVLKTFIGPPIQDSFAKAYNLSGDILQDIATCFRNRYKDYELLKAVPYDGIYEVFDKLMERNVKLAVATYKRQDCAPGSTAPAFPLLRRLRLSLSRAASGSPVPATKPAPRPSFLPNFIFLTPLYFFRPAQGEVKKRPHTYPTFALSNPQS